MRNMCQGRGRLLVPLMLMLVVATPGLRNASAASGPVVGVIVELDGEPAAYDIARARLDGRSLSAGEIQARRAQIAMQHRQILSAFDASGIPVTEKVAQVAGPSGIEEVPFRYTLVFNGFALDVPESAMRSIEGVPGVKRVHRERVHSPTLDRSVSYIRADALYGDSHELIRSQWHIDGLEGQGTHIAVVDSGIDWFHEMFDDPRPPRLGVVPDDGSGNHKVVYSLPLAGPDGTDPLSHGTHLASIAAGYRGTAPGNDGIRGTSDDVALHGVAPQAKLMSYRVCNAECFDSAIIMAFEDAVSPATVNGFDKPVADVINVSLAAHPTPDAPDAIAANNVVLAGTVFVAAAGNQGANPEAIGTPAIATRAIAVGSASDPSAYWSGDVLDPSTIARETLGAVTPAAGLATAAGERTAIPLQPMVGTTKVPNDSIAQRLVYVGSGETAAGYPPEVRGRIALVKTDPAISTTHIAVANYATAAGAVGVIRITDSPMPVAVQTMIPSAGAYTADETYLWSLFGLEPGVRPATGAISTKPFRMSTSGAAASIAASSSRGPVLGFGQVKPDLVAPGVYILGAVTRPSERAVANGLSGAQSYGVSGGTSQAAPHVVGAVALLRQAHPSWTPDMIRTVLINTATNLRGSDGSLQAAERILAQGGGLIDIAAAAGARALMGVTGDGITNPSILGSHSFGMTGTTRTVTVTLRDITGTGGVYDLRVVGNSNTGTGITPLLAHASGEGLSSIRVAVPPNGDASFTAIIQVDNGGSSVPVDAQWYVTADPIDGGDSLRMPFYARVVG